MHLVKTELLIIQRFHIHLVELILLTVNMMSMEVILLFQKVSHVAHMIAQLLTQTFLMTDMEQMKML